jgi:uncharacterized RmlC-like cupin family protein
MFRKLAVFALCVVAASTVVAQSFPEIRMTPAEIRTSTPESNQIGSSGLPGVYTKVLVGNPEQPGFYSILLFVPAHTTIQAHSHRDSRVATVVSGVWHFGYGNHFDAAVLKTLPAGSVYTEPGGDNHFARTEAEAVVVQISGYGPTNTIYFNPNDDPKSQKNK